MQPQYVIVFLSTLLFILSGVFILYAFVFLKQARAMLARAETTGSRATQVFQDAQKLRNETRRMQEEIALIAPDTVGRVPTLAEVPVLEVVGADDFDESELRTEEPEPAPALDYENFQGLPVKSNEPAAVIESLREHGFIVRFNQPAVEVQIAYQKPDTTNEPVRATYRAPAEIFPLNNLHEAGKAATALWAARRFVAQYKYPEFENYPYL